MRVQRIALNDIEIVPGRNYRDEMVTTDLEESMNAIGQLHPIQVVPGEQEGRFTLNAGERRYRAARKLGWTTIEAVVMADIDEIDVELAAIDENIVRRDLQGAALDQALKRRKELYLQKFPETAAHVAGGIARAQGEDAERPKSFATDTAEKTGKSSRTIERSVRRAERLSPATMKAYETGEITQTQADILAGRPWEEQDELLSQVSGKSVEETRRIVSGEPEEAQGAEGAGAEEDATPMKMLETLYMHGQKIVAVLEKLGGMESLDPEFVESVLNLQISLNEEFTTFADAVADKTSEDGESLPSEPPF